MDETGPGFWKALRRFLVALLDATLILLALCLWLAWEVVSTAQEVSTTVMTQVRGLAPVRNDLATLTDSVVGLRSTLDALPDRIVDQAQAQELQRQVAQLVELTEAVNLRLNRAVDEPGVLIDRAIKVAAGAAGAQMAGLAGCVAGWDAGVLPGAE